MTPDPESSPTAGTPASPPEGAIRLTVNGEEREVSAGLTISTFLAELDLLPGMVVVERNRQIVPRDQYDEVALQEGDTLELVHFVGGG